MNRRIWFALLALLFVLPLGLAQAADAAEPVSAVNTTVNGVATPTALVARPITRLHLVGNGIAINSDNPMDFMHAKAVIGAVRVRRHAGTEEAAETTETTAAGENAGGAWIVKRIGILFLDGTAYRLRNVEVSADEISADIYEKRLTVAPLDTDTNENTTTGGYEKVGELKVARYEKPGRDIWAGELSLGDTLYNAYFIGVKRRFKLVEAAKKIGSYCENHPDDERCSSVVAECAQNPRGCKARVVNYCKENPKDRRCVSLKRHYCRNNASDVRCREFLKESCKENPAQAFCRVKKIRGHKVVSIEPTEVKVVTPEEGKEAEELSTGTATVGGEETSEAEVVE
jgi:hypothetical protein